MIFAIFVIFAKNIVMKKLLLILLACIFVSACSGGDKDEVLIEKTIENYYESLNKRDFKTLETLVSERMNKKISYFKDLANELVVYKSVKVNNVIINGNLALVEVEVVDQFDNKIECNWSLFKVNQQWKIDMPHISASEV